ncbi:MAG: 30S ribosomal protein S12 methylthiotransferase RimO [Syntrophomonas sp.]
MKVGFINLGCAKNRVDTEIMMGLVKKAGHQLVDKIEQAEAVIINTCGFILEAQEEAIDTILETGRLKNNGLLRYLIAVGCLTQRYGAQLYEEIPELDGIWGLLNPSEWQANLDTVLSGTKVFSVNQPPDRFIEQGQRIVSTPPGWAYLKAVEGCSNHCRYCSIPSIKGPLRSRSIEELVKEAEQMVNRGIKELIVIGQDTAIYGKDLYGKSRLSELIDGLDGVEGLEWLRLMYLHPAHITGELIETFARGKKVVPYLEIPIQHASSRILSAMGRRHDKEHLIKLFQDIRAALPGVVLRTTVMLGFPGETEEDFQELLEFIEATRFDWLGAFTFQAQEGTPAYTMPEQVDDEIKTRRKDIVMSVQKHITRKKNIERLNTRQKVLVSSTASKSLYLGRAAFQGPEVDGMTIVKSEKSLKKGCFYEVLLKAVRDFDMIGEVVNEPTQ